MAFPTFPHLRALRRLQLGSIEWLNDPLKMMLVGPGYAPSAGVDFIGSGAGSPGGEEIVVAGYTGGYGGSSRLLLTDKTITKDATLKRVVYDCADFSFGVLGNGTNVPVAYGIIVLEATTDEDSPVITTVAFPQRDTDGTEFPVYINPLGVFALQVTDAEV